MSFEEEGFLSETLAHRFSTDPDCAPWFALAGELNRVGLKRALMERDVDLDGTQPVTWICYFRALSSFQGTVSLADRGLIVEARTLARSVGEAALHLIATKHDPAHAAALKADEIRSRKGRTKLLLKQPDWIEPHHVKMLQSQLQLLNQQPAAAINFEEIAKAANASILYHVYRQLSSDAAHVSLESLHRYLGKEADGTVFLQPVPKLSPHAINETLDCAFTFFFVALSRHNDVAPDKVLETTVGDLWQLFLGMTRKMHSSAEEMADLSRLI